MSASGKTATTVKVIRRAATGNARQTLPEVSAPPRPATLFESFTAQVAATRQSLGAAREAERRHFFGAWGI